MGARISIQSSTSCAASAEWRTPFSKSGAKKSAPAGYAQNDVNSEKKISEIWVVAIETVIFYDVKKNFK